jgi:hypothetical protein
MPPVARPLVLVFALFSPLAAGGCGAILGISEGQYDPNPFGTTAQDADIAEASEAASPPASDASDDAQAPSEASTDAASDAPAIDAAPDAPADAAGAPCGLLIDDLEDGDGNIIRCAGRNGTWYTHNDGTTGGTQVPAPNVPFLPVTPGYNSNYSAHTKGSGFTTSGAEMGFHFVIGASGPQTYDLSVYSGITFWAKSATASFTLYVNFPDQYTCPGASNCGDTYGKSETIGTSWTQVALPFTALGTDSATPPHPFDKAHVYSIEFHAARNTTFEIWVDNVTLSK